MEENFNPVARTRANYFTPGSPVQFVCVELLRGDVSGENAVCLTFKNISRVNLTALEIHFKCKASDGSLLCEDRFEYQGLNVKPGDSFGMDDAVFITAKEIASVDVSLCNAYSGNRVVHLSSIKRVRLPAPIRLGQEMEQALEARMNRPGLKYQPQVLENGWYCACGAFHPQEEDTVYCSECGCDRILLQNALNTLMQPQKPKEEEPLWDTPLVPETEPEEPTRVLEAPVAPPQPAKEPAPQKEHTRVLDASVWSKFQPGMEKQVDTEGTRVMPFAPKEPQPELSDQPEMHAYSGLYEDEAEDRDGIAEALIRWVPPITAIICAGIALCGFIYYQFVL